MIVPATRVKAASRQRRAIAEPETMTSRADVADADRFRIQTEIAISRCATSATPTIT